MLTVDSMARTKAPFRNIWASQTEIGRKFGVSAVVLGRILLKHGLRDDEHRPTPLAGDKGFAVFTPLKDGTPHWMWSRERIFDLLQSDGWRLRTPLEFHVDRIVAEWEHLVRADEEAEARRPTDLFDPFRCPLMARLVDTAPKSLRKQVRLLAADRLAHSSAKAWKRGQ
jgi:hypothetical protein